MKNTTSILSFLLVSVIAFAQTPSICIVSVDPGSNYNMIGWDKLAFPAASYNIYQETSPGNFTAIGNTPTGSLSVYFDVSSDPDLGSSTYKITTIDGGGTESAQSASFTTIFLTAALSGSSVSLFWSAPGGFTPMQYNIWRGATISTMSLIDSMSSSFTSYVDAAPPVGTWCYRIEAPNPAGCVPTAPATDYSSSFSNTSCTTVLATEELDQDNLSVEVAPNPFNSTTTFYVSGPDKYTLVRLEVYNIIGGKVKVVEGISDAEFTLDRGGLNDGIYIYKLLNEEKGDLIGSGKLIIR